MPTLDDVLHDPKIYTVLRREELVSESAAGLPLPVGIPGTARRVRTLVSIWVVGWRWFLARGPWSGRPTALRWAWWVVVPVSLGIVFGSGGGIRGVGVMAASAAFWLPIIGGIVLRARLRGYARRQVAVSERQAQEALIAEELSRLGQSPSSPSRIDPNRLRG
ncbi:hypothetical protein TPY_0413 [Sulfobacillus acidophilus TPY]|uniref:Transmembrane protein n=1 Tax=Sulfobacillus acidophilus (strain ATCC 700253 / DSM 10332 / NAL) TaxID=679936 RepID=G8TY39_SULAD|nr:hypothetical protein TPY_0413 [Sulfobacillus acidophilus TPY]AEW03946.1 hypothetical protein Sulac_0378 [Sulfobacillus acidophilus DSM 10332]